MQLNELWVLTAGNCLENSVDYRRRSPLRHDIVSPLMVESGDVNYDKVERVIPISDRAPQILPGHERARRRSRENLIWI